MQTLFIQYQQRRKQENYKHEIQTVSERFPDYIMEDTYTTPSLYQRDAL